MNPTNRATEQTIESKLHLFAPADHLAFRSRVSFVLRDPGTMKFPSKKLSIYVFVFIYL